MWKTYGYLSLSILLLAGCGSDPWVEMEQQREYEQAQWHKSRVESLVAEVKHKYSAQQPGLIIHKAFNNVVLVAGEVDSPQAQKQVFDELSAIQHAKVHMFALVRQDASPKRRADDEALRAQVSGLIPSYYGLAVYVVDGRVGVVGPLRTNHYETLRGTLTDIERKVPGTRPDPYLVLTRHSTQQVSSPEYMADLGDWAPTELEVTPTLQPANLSGTVSSTKAWVDTPKEPVRAAVAPAQTQSTASYGSGRSTAGSAGGGSGMAIWGDLLQAAGQVAQATGSGQGYESGLLMQGVGAVLAGNNAAAQQALTRAEQSGAGNSLVDSRPVPQCASFAASPGVTVAAYTAVRNTCDFDISVNWCRSSGPVGSGCGVVLHLPKNTSQRIYDPIKEAFVQAACRYPLHVFAPDGGKWTGSNGGFSCRPI